MVKLKKRRALRPQDAARNVQMFGTQSSGKLTKEKFLTFFGRIDSKIGKGTVYDVLVNMRQVLMMAFETGTTVHVPELGVFRLIGRGIEDPDNPEKSNQTLSVNLLMDTGWKTDVTPTTMEAATVVQETIKPIPLDLQDVFSQTYRQTLTSGGMASLTGKNLKFDPTKSDEGIWLVPTTADGGDPVKIDKIKKPITSVMVDFSIPSGLVSGASYTLRIAARQRNCKTAQIAELADVLTVA